MTLPGLSLPGPYPLISYLPHESSPSLSHGPKTFPSAVLLRDTFPTALFSSDRTTHTGDCPPRPLARVTNFKIAETRRRAGESWRNRRRWDWLDSRRDHRPNSQKGRTYRTDDDRCRPAGPFDEAAMAGVGGSRGNFIPPKA